MTIKMPPASTPAMTAERLAEMRLLAAELRASGANDQVDAHFAECLSEIDRAHAEIANLTRRIEGTPPWPPDNRPLNDAEMRALKLRWSTGPELYQADADALIATVIAAYAQRDALLREVQEARAAGAGVLSALSQAEDAPKVPNAPGWWWYIDASADARWRPVDVYILHLAGLAAEGGITVVEMTKYGTWGGRCLGDPR